jgi:hypothetical protein
MEAGQHTPTSDLWLPHVGRVGCACPFQRPQQKDIGLMADEEAQKTEADIILQNPRSNSRTKAAWCACCERGTKVKSVGR